MTYGFVAYIDESGDDGLKRVKPLDPDGSSEWFILSAVVVRSSNENAVGHWQQEILARFNHTQSRDIHYRKLLPIKRRIACDIIGARPLRIFAVMSNKKNIKGYRNPRTHPEKNYLYWWLTRLLLERVTRFCADASRKLYGGPQPIKMVFSLRGGMSYDRLIAYLGLLRFEAEIGHLYLPGEIAWSVVDLDQIRAIAHKNEAGLQLADVAAGAFYDSVCMDRVRPCDPSFAKLLIPRLYQKRGVILGYGIKPMPQLSRMRLRLPQREIFEALGFDPRRW